MSRRLRSMPRMKNPHWTPAQEKEIEKAEALGTRATIMELGVAEFLKTHMPCGPEIAVAREVLGTVLELRQQSQSIHAGLRTQPRRTKKLGAAKFGHRKEGVA
jgi:hypothetical protein